MGSAESLFLLHDWGRATPLLQGVSQRCVNPRIKTSAEMRLGDMLFVNDKSEYEAAYEKARDPNINVVDRFFPSLLYNLGEGKYRQGKYPQAKFFFAQFLEFSKKNSTCLPYAMKRRADTAARLNARFKDVVGLYLAVKDAFPNSDVGRYAFIHSLLLDLAEVPKVEQQRRVRAVDEELAKISSGDISARGYLEKGLALLEAGEPTALGYLVRIKDKLSFSPNEGAMGSFIRSHILSQWASQAMEDAVKSIEREKRNQEEMEGQNEARPLPSTGVFDDWLKGTPEEEKAITSFTAKMMERIVSRIEDADIASAVSLIKYWEASPLLSKYQYLD